MRQLATAVVLLAAVVAQPVQAKELGTIGHLFPIAEPDLLTFIGQRLKDMEDSGEMDRLQREAEARVKAHAVRPAPVAGLTPAKTDRAFLYDPTFTVRETRRLMTICLCLSTVIKACLPRTSTCWMSCRCSRWQRIS